MARLVAYREASGSIVAGAVRDGAVVRLQGSDDAGVGEASPILPLIAAGRTSPAPGAAAVPLDTVALLSPIPAPGKIIGVGLNYLSHVAEAEREVPRFPVLFAKFANTVAGPYDPIRIPRVSHRIDYEGELAVVIGRRGRYIPRDDALTHVAGYMVANDVSARDYQFRTKEMLSGKSFDGFAPMGPWLATPDEVGDLAGCRLRTWVNGELRQEAALGEMVFSVAHLVSYISDIMTLDPGDVILTGTPSGIGATMDPRRWLRAGDEVRIEIEGIGEIRNCVEAEEVP